MVKKKKQQKPWQYKFSFGLSMVMLLLIVGYFIQSFIEIRKVEPVRIAFERISERSGKPSAVPGSEPVPVVVAEEMEKVGKK